MWFSSPKENKKERVPRGQRQRPVAAFHHLLLRSEKLVFNKSHSGATGRDCICHERHRVWHSANGGSGALETRNTMHFDTLLMGFGPKGSELTRFHLFFCFFFFIACCFVILDFFTLEAFFWGQAERTSRKKRSISYFLRTLNVFARAEK